MSDNVSVYLIFTDHEELTPECKDDIFHPLVQAFEKIYTSSIVRLKVKNMKIKKVKDVMTRARSYATDAAYQALKDFEELYEDGNPTVMALASKATDHNWNWTIELRLGNTTEDSGFISINSYSKVPDDVGYQ